MPMLFERRTLTCFAQGRRRRRHGGIAPSGEIVYSTDKRGDIDKRLA